MMNYEFEELAAEIVTKSLATAAEENVGLVR